MATSSQNSTVKEFLDSNDANITSLPSHYISRGQTISATEIIECKEIPTIDFSLLISKTPNERAKTIQKLGQACEDWGCFMVVNHGVPEDLRTSMMDAFVAFFDLTENEKQNYRNKLFHPVVYNTSFNPAVKDVTYWRDSLKIEVAPNFNFPEQLHDFRLSSQEFVRHTREILMELIRGICESLELEENYMEEFLNLKSCYQIFVGNLYLPCPQPELVMGIPPHSDAGILTLLMQNSSFHGLQVMHNGKWIQVQPIPNSFFIIVSDLMEIFTNGKYKSVLHRATVDKKITRISVLTVLAPPLDVVVTPAPKMIQMQNMSPTFRGVTYKEYIKLYQINQSNKSSLATIML